MYISAEEEYKKGLVTITGRVTNLLNKQPLYRERHNKQRGHAKLLIEKFPSLATIDRKILERALAKHESIDRSWRKILSENPSLRGSDYDEKTPLEHKKQQDLGYISPFKGKL